MAARVTRRNKAVLSGNLQPHYRDVTTTLCRMTDYPVAVTPVHLAGPDLDALTASLLSGFVTWYENTDGAGAFGGPQVITSTAGLAQVVGVRNS